MGKVIFHTLMTLITGGFWLIPLAIWFMLSNSGSKKRK